MCPVGEEETVEDPDAIAAGSTDPSEVQLGPVPSTNDDGAPTTGDAWQAGLEEAAAGGVEPSEPAQGAPASGAEGATAADGTPMARSPSQDRPRARTVSTNKVWVWLTVSSHSGFVLFVFWCITLCVCVCLCGWGMGGAWRRRPLLSPPPAGPLWHRRQLAHGWCMRRQPTRAASRSECTSRPNKPLVVHLSCLWM